VIERVLSEADVDAIARRVVELLGEPDPAASAAALVWTTARVAAEIGMSEEWVRDHRDDLGALPAKGERPRLLFDPAAVRAWATAREEGERSPRRNPAPAKARRRAPAQRMSSGVDLLPIRGDRRAA